MISSERVLSVSTLPPITPVFGLVESFDEGLGLADFLPSGIRIAEAVRVRRGREPLAARTWEVVAQMPYVPLLSARPTETESCRGGVKAAWRRRGDGMETAWCPATTVSLPVDRHRTTFPPDWFRRGRAGRAFQGRARRGERRTRRRRRRLDPVRRNSAAQRDRSDRCRDRDWARSCCGRQRKLNCWRLRPEAKQRCRPLKLRHAWPGKCCPLTSAGSTAPGLEETPFDTKSDTPPDEVPL